VPWYAKAVATLIESYALSPIALIPDFIPVLGYLDELVLLPPALGGRRALNRPHNLVEHRAKAARVAERPVSKAGATLIVTL
jgi:uncharacterized membrane protein YkvA (DUF1232 family)